VTVISFPDNLESQLPSYFCKAITDGIEQPDWIASEVLRANLTDSTSGLHWNLRDAHGKSVSVVLDPRVIEVESPVPNSSEMSDLAWIITILAQEYELSYSSSEFDDGEVPLLQHTERREHRRSGRGASE